MTNIRYGVSFFISAILYGVLGFVIVTLLDVPKILRPKAEPVIRVSIITPFVEKPKVITPPAPVVPTVIVPPKKIKKPTVKPITKKKIVKKKIIKKKIIKKIVKKKIVKKKIVKKKIIKKIKPKKIIKKVVKREVYTPPPSIVEEPYIAPQPVIRRVEPAPIYTPPAPAPTPKRNNAAAKRAFLSQVRSMIITNKRYPKLAKRRHIEGSVKVRFNINSSGNVSNIRFLNGKSILQKAVKKAIHNSFPMAIPHNMKGELPINDISVTVNFRLD